MKAAQIPQTSKEIALLQAGVKSLFAENLSSVQKFAQETPDLVKKQQELLDSLTQLSQIAQSIIKK